MRSVTVFPAKTTPICSDDPDAWRHGVNINPKTMKRLHRTTMYRGENKRPDSVSEACLGVVNIPNDNGPRLRASSVTSGRFKPVIC